MPNKKNDVAVNHFKLHGRKKAPMDVWNSTYSMLEAALVFKNAFQSLE